MATSTNAVRRPARTSEGGASDLERLEQELAHLARALEAVQRKRNYPLDRALYLLLLFLEREGPQPIATIAAQFLLDDSTVTRQVAALEHGALVDRIPNPQDGRSMLIRVTSRGRQMAAQMRDMRLGRVALLFEDWSEAQRESLAALLAKLNASLRARI